MSLVTDLRTCGSYEEAVGSYRCELPDRFNVAADTIERQRTRSDPALFCLDGDGVPESITFAELATATARLAAALRRVGVARGSRVCVVLPTSLESAIVQLAVVRLGGVVASLRQHREAALLRHELGCVEPDLVVTDGQRLELVRPLLARSDTKLVTADRGAWRSWRDQTTEPASTDGADHRLSDLLDAGATGGGVAPTGPDDPAFISFTSGTTGAPKAVVVPHRAVAAGYAGFQMYTNLGPKPGDVFFTSLGLTLGGMRPVALPAWHYGHAVVAVDELAPESYCSTLVGLGVSCAYLMPNVLRGLRGLGDAIARFDWSRLRTIMYSGEAIGEAAQSWLEEMLGVEINSYYGATETAYVAAGCRYWFDTPAGAVGRRVPGRALETVDQATLQLQPPGEVGLLAVRRDDPGLCLGYRQPGTGETRFEASDATDSHFVTSDVGVVERDGTVRYIGRSGDVIAGEHAEHVRPADVEDAAATIAAVAEAAAIQLESAVGVRELIVCVTLHPGGSATDAVRDVTEVVARRFGMVFGVPRVTVLAELPRTAGTNKHDRARLRKQLSESGPAGAAASPVRGRPGGRDRA